MTPCRAGCCVLPLPALVGPPASAPRCSVPGPTCAAASPLCQARDGPASEASITRHSFSFSGAPDSREAQQAGPGPPSPGLGSPAGLQPQARGSELLGLLPPEAVQFTPRGRFWLQGQSWPFPEQGPPLPQTLPLTIGGLEGQGLWKESNEEAGLSPSSQRVPRPASSAVKWR